MNHFTKFDSDKIIVFDGYCNFCSWGVQFLLRRDKQNAFLFSASQSESGKELLSHLAILNGESILYLRKGKILKSSTAVLYIIKDLGYPWKVFFVFILVPTFIRDAFYNVFAKVRYSFFGRRATCRMPNENELKRFL